MIEMTDIYLMAKKYRTVGDLWVLDTEKFDLLLGREWQTMNRMGILEQPEGTVLRFLSQGTYYEVNVAPVESEEERGNTKGKGRPREEHLLPEQQQRTACVVQVEVKDGERRRGQGTDARRVRPGADEGGIPEGSGQTKRPWSLAEGRSDLGRQPVKTQEMSLTFSRGEEGAYLEEGEINEFEPGGNKPEVVDATPESQSEETEEEEGKVRDEKDDEKEES